MKKTIDDYSGRKYCIFVENVYMPKLTIQVGSINNYFLIRDFVIKHGGLITNEKTNDIKKPVKEIPFVQMSNSSLMKEWDSVEDEQWDSLLNDMPAIKN